MATNDVDVKTNDSESCKQSSAADTAGRKRDLALVSRSTYLKEKALQYLFFACAFLAVVTVVLIFAFTMMQAAPVFTDIGLANFFSFTWLLPRATSASCRSQRAPRSSRWARSCWVCRSAWERPCT